MENELEVGGPETEELDGWGVVTSLVDKPESLGVETMEG